MKTRKTDIPACLVLNQRHIGPREMMPRQQRLQGTRTVTKVVEWARTPQNESSISFTGEINLASVKPLTNTYVPRCEQVVK